MVQNVGKCVSKVSCGGWLGLYMQIIEAVSFWKAKSSEFFSINQGVAGLHIVAHNVFDLYQWPVE